MTFQPLIPFGGYSGWRFLQSTLESQQTQFANSPSQAADREYFQENIGAIETASDLVSDYRLLRVTLGAFGLQDDLPNRAFIEQIMTQGVDDDTDLANRLANKSYLALAETFDFSSASQVSSPSLSASVDTALADERYFRDNIASVSSADDLLADTRMLRITLASYGLLDDLPDRDFLRDVLTQGTDSPLDLANQQDNPAYREMADDFGFDRATGPNTASDGFASSVLSGLERLEFGRDLERLDTRFRSVAEAAQSLQSLSESSLTDRDAWIRASTDPELSDLFASAFGISRGFDRLSLDQKINALQAGADDAFGSRRIEQFGDPERQNELVERFANALGFDADSLSGFSSPAFAENILSLFDRQQFEVAVGEQDDDMRLILNAVRELPAISQSSTDTTGWLTILGNPPVRSLFETAFALPSSIGTLDLDQQIKEFRNAAERVLGQSDVAQFSDEGAVDNLIRAFSAQSQIASFPSASTPGASAITLLQNLV